MIKLQNISTRAPQELQKSVIKKKTESLLSQLQELQALLFAEKKHSILIVLQGLDASGKDGAVQNVFSGVNPMGCKVKAFKVPTEEEMAHDFLWRIHQHAPEKGMIQIFNRSHYEDVLVPRVHDRIGKDEIKRRYEHINAWELLIQDSGTHLLKFYLHISKEEQAIRFNERLSIPEKRWKYKESDIEESKLWDKYQIAFEDIFKSCDKAAPWTIVPSDQNWYKDYLIASAIVEKLLALKMKYPELTKET
jgi:PPK2 family polyphosphate:nucleotide phosphotransferase